MSKLPFSSSIVTHALVETCVFGGLTYYLTGRISSLEKRVEALEELLLERLRKDNMRLNPRPVPTAKEVKAEEGEEGEEGEENIPSSPPPLVRQHAVIEYEPIPIPIEIEMDSRGLKEIDEEVEKEIAELNLT